jgi:hypothetical protein
MPSVAASELLPPSPILLFVASDFSPSNSGRPSGGSDAFGGSVGAGAFGPQDVTGQAPFDAPFQFIVDTPPETDDLPLDVVVARVPDDLQPIFLSTNIPSVVLSAPTFPPNQAVAEPPAVTLLLTGFLAILWCHRRSGLVRDRDRLNRGRIADLLLQSLIAFGLLPKLRCLLHGTVRT